jgi:hypothetical protein
VKQAAPGPRDGIGHRTGRVPGSARVTPRLARPFPLQPCLLFASAMHALTMPLLWRNPNFSYEGATLLDGIALSRSGLRKSIADNQPRIAREPPPCLPAVAIAPWTAEGSLGRDIRLPWMVSLIWMDEAQAAGTDHRAQVIAYEHAGIAAETLAELRGFERSGIAKPGDQAPKRRRRRPSWQAGQLSHEIVREIPNCCPSSPSTDPEVLTFGPEVLTQRRPEVLTFAFS